jgi:hypothetical protein
LTLANQSAINASTQHSASPSAVPRTQADLSRPRFNRQSILLALTGILAILGFFCGHPDYGHNLLLALFLELIALVLGLIGTDEAGRSVISVSFIKQRASLWIALAALIFVHFGFALHELRTTTGEDIDSFTFQRDAVQSLLKSEDPFGTTHANIYSPKETRRFYSPDLVVNNRVQVGLQYPPLTFLCALPGYVLGDIRWGFVLAVMAAAILLFAAMPSLLGLIIAACILLSPSTFIVESRCWTEPLVWMMLCAVIYAAIKRPRYLPVALGLFLASKQYSVLGIPLFGFLLPRFSWKAYARLVLYSCSVAAATLLPFALWNFRALWHDLVLFHIAQPFRIDAVSFGVPFPIMQKVGPLLLAIFILWCVRKPKPNPAAFLSAYGMVLLLFFATSKQAFLNYYFLICNTFLLAALLAFHSLPESDQASPLAAEPSVPTHS